MVNRILILFFFITKLSFAQKQYCITVLDEDKSVIPGAIINCKSNAGITNNDGNYCLEYISNNDSIEVRYLGYNTLTITIKDIQELNNKILLTRRVNEIDSIKISEDVALYYIQKVILKIPENYSSKAFLQKVNYIQYHKENDKYVRFIQCLSDVIQNKYKSDDNKFSRRFKHIAVRKSINYEENKETHSDHFYELFGHNPIWSTENSFLNISSTPFFSYKIKSINDSDIVIEFREKQYYQEFISKGFCVINKSDWAIKQIEESKLINKECPAKREFTTEGLNWKFQNQKKSLTFKKNKSNIWYCNFISFTYNHHLYRNNFKDKLYTVEENFVMEMFEPVYLDHIDLTGFDKSSNLYLINNTLNFNEWSNYDFLNSKACPSKLKTDLEKERKLDEQFKLVGRN